MPSIVDRQPSEVTADDLRAFLEERHVEGPRLDYKLALQDTIAETLVAMANSQGGVVLVGVDEENQRPTVWPGLPGRDWLDTISNHNQFENVPPVRYEPAIIQLPENGTRPILVIRVPSSSRRPHMSRRKGVLIRVDSQDRPPDLETLASLFRQQPGSGVRRKALGPVPFLLTPGMTTPDDRLYLSVLASPVYEVQSLPMSEAVDREIERIVHESVPGIWEKKTRGAGHLDLQMSGAPGKAFVRADGVATIQGSCR